MRSVRSVLLGLSVAGVIAGATAAPAAAQARGPAPTKLAFHAGAMGTTIDITLWSADRAGAEAAAQAVFAEFARLDQAMSNWVDTSDVQRINAAAGGEAVAVGDETFRILEVAADVSRRSRGVFDVTVGAFRGLWKFDEDKDGSLPSRADVLARKRRVGWRGVVLDRRARTVRLRRRGMAITLGGIAKGYAVDRGVAILRERGFRDFILQAGGDLYVGGAKGATPWRVGIRDPRGARDAPFALTELSDMSFSTSGDYERAVIAGGVRYHHILDPRTGYPATASRSVTVLAKDAFTADAWSKVLFILGPDAGIPLAESLGLQVVFVDKENRVRASKGLAIVEGDARAAIGAGLAGKLLILHPPTDGV